MWPSPTSMVIRAGWLCVLLAVVSADSVVTIYKKVGDEVVLKPGAVSVPGTITNIMWRDGPNIAAEWDGTDIDLNRQFKARGSLDISSGDMTIKGLTRDDSQVYTPEINTKVGSPTRLIVISPVPTPTVIISCDDDKTSCILTCDANTTGAEPFTYRWNPGELTGSSKEQRITKEDSLTLNEFSCELENPVSQESSLPIPNPFITIPESPEAGGKGKVSTGVIVFISLLAALLLLVAVHRLKAGEWFFQKASMPWETDFWRKHERPPRDAAESNGTTAHQEKEQTDEETPMT
ncbi:T-lymphocyte surface antigen Ly-9-like [Enoplosus armatus]|uniref:T-lymphocyte surface antigen Ly-9-like n=1 Tax=Enoplosus armatus TaxID=215367 RepID=UPI0039962B5E